MKSMKKTLIASAVSIVLCAALLVGATFAWFTDSIVNKGNKIQAGNLDIELYARNAAGEYAEVKEDTKLFDDAFLWEPGAVQTVYFKLVNGGSLPVKYRFAVEVTDEDNSTNVSGDKFFLSDYLVSAQVAGDEETIFATREEAIAAARGGGAFSAIKESGYKNEGELAPEAVKYVAFVVHMPETVGNEANHASNRSAPSIELAISFVATQLAEGATLDILGASDYASINSALKEGKTVVLTGDVDAGRRTSAIFANGKVPATLSLSGKKISAATEGTNDVVGAISAVYAGTVLTVEGTGTVYGGEKRKVNFAVRAKDGAKVILKGGDYTVGLDADEGADGNGNSVIFAEGGEVEIYGGTYKNPHDSDFTLNLQDNVPGSKITVYGGSFYMFNPSAAYTEPAPDQPHNFVAEGYKVITEKKADGTWYTVVKA